MSDELTVKIELCDYKKIAKGLKRRKVDIENKEVEHSLAFLQKSRAKFSQVQRPAKKGDFVEIEYSYRNENENFSQAIKDKFVLGEAGFLPGFEHNLQELEGGGNKEFSLRDKQNKKIDFKVKMLSVQKMELPELNDDFARALGKFKDLAELRNSARRSIFREKEIAESLRLRQEILENAVAASRFIIPDILIEQAQKRLLADLKQELAQKLKITFDDYLKKINKTEKDLNAHLLARAEKQVKASLLLEEISKRENIFASKQEVEQRINSFLKQFPDIKTAKKEVDLEKLKKYIEEVVRNEKTLARLESFVP